MQSNVPSTELALCPLCCLEYVDDGVNLCEQEEARLGANGGAPPNGEPPNGKERRTAIRRGEGRQTAIRRGERGMIFLRRFSPITIDFLLYIGIRIRLEKKSPRRTAIRRGEGWQTAIRRGEGRQTAIRR